MTTVSVGVLFSRVIVIFHVIIFVAKRILRFNASIYVPQFLLFANYDCIFVTCISLSIYTHYTGLFVTGGKDLYIDCIEYELQKASK